jgi:pyrroline-5-carboxylate reductase
MDSPSLVLIGCGNMGRAIVAGVLRAGLVRADRLVLADPERSAREAMSRIVPGGSRVMSEADEAIAALRAMEDASGVAGQVLVAVKPQSLSGLAAMVKPALAGTSRVVISILAGTPTGRVRGLLGDQLRVVRAMPNLPASIGRGATAVCVGETAQAGDEAFAMAIFRAVGPVVLRMEESMLDAFTALAGSGPAYVFYLAEAMVKAGVEMGFSAEDSLAAVKATLTGAAELLATSEELPATLRGAVTSKGGTTAAAMAVLDDRRVMESLRAAIIAARDRGAELAKLT